MVDIVIVDDHDLVRTGMSRILDGVDDFTVLAMGDSGEQAIHLVKQLSPDVLIMDVKMPGIGGLEATRRIKLIDEHVNIIAVTSCESDLYPSQLLQAGASAYLTKRATPAELIEAVTEVAAGKTFMSAEIAQQLALKSLSPTMHQDSPFEKLSSRELQIAMMIIGGEKPNDIAETLNVSPKTINSFRYRIHEKFKINSDVELVLFAVKHKLFDVDALE